MKNLLCTVGLIVGFTMGLTNLAKADGCGDKPCTAPPSELAVTSLSDTYKKASDAFLRAHVPTDKTLSGIWSAVVVAPVDQNWNLDSRLPATASQAISVEFATVTAGANDFLEVPGVTAFAATFTAVAGPQGPNKVNYSSDSAFFATYVGGDKGVLDRNVYFEHECRLLSDTKLLCALTFRSITPAIVNAADAPYLGHIVGFIGYKHN